MEKKKSLGMMLITVSYNSCVNFVNLLHGVFVCVTVCRSR